MKTKIISLVHEELIKEDPFPEKVSLEQLRKIWDDENYTYTDDELMRIREWLYAVAAIAIRLENERARVKAQETKTIPIVLSKKAS